MLALTSVDEIDNHSKLEQGAVDESAFQCSGHVVSATPPMGVLLAQQLLQSIEHAFQLRVASTLDRFVHTFGRSCS